ncbi:Glyoxalase/bleomycin resistance protein/dioxygenase [Kribbella flavida DSM 17836]|uniref:Glyoxalase/bleomycin resistance protein/dioxygenase n=1 Tax=Kribbella flavida (strain DSM 17836 / JCM 10339 / NBRC 14399) TaxID=479435 RepID=D2Q0I1_KRIFD|nr:VOC family protein [Kribbella flavida]ADB31973.1 Glyoxalase/bleomycin resistance protein/dioxygenase [Kribbella flavida DSM 17836]
MNHITAIGTVAIPVTDQDRAVAFYVGTLGFELRMDAALPQLDGRWIVVAPPGSTTSIALQPASDQTPAGTDTGIRLSTPDAAAAHTALASQGVGVADLLSWPGVPPMFSFQDPDHNRLYLVEQ